MKKNLLYLSIFLVISSLSLLIDAKNEKKNNKRNAKKVDREDSSEMRRQSEIRQVEPEVVKAAIEAMSEEEKQALNLYMVEVMSTMEKLDKSEASINVQEIWSKYAIRIMIVPQIVFVDPSSLPKDQESK
jgi:hypothetical protein